jgi:hypothetical protein
MVNRTLALAAVLLLATACPKPACPPATPATGPAVDCGGGSAPMHGTVPGMEQENTSQTTVVVVEDRIYKGAEGNAAVKIEARFATRDQLIAAVDLRSSVGSFGGKTWTLADIAIDVSLNATGNGATLRVSGPKPLVTAYGDGFKARAGAVEATVIPLKVSVEGELK